MTGITIGKTYDTIASALLALTVKYGDTARVIDVIASSNRRQAESKDEQE